MVAVLLAQINRVIRSAQNKQSAPGGALRKELPILEAPGLWEAMVQAVGEAFEVGPRIDVADKDGGTRKPAL